MPQIIISMLCFKTLSGLKLVLPIFNQSSNSTKINHRLMLKAYVENLFKEVGGERDQEMAHLVKDNYPGSL